MNHGVRNDSQKNNRQRKQKDDFYFGYLTDACSNVLHGEEARYRNKTVEVY